MEILDEERKIGCRESKKRMEGIGWKERQDRERRNHFSCGTWLTLAAQ